MTHSLDLNSAVTQFVQDPQSYLDKEGRGKVRKKYINISIRQAMGSSP